MKTLDRFIDDQENIELSLAETRASYRKHDPGWYLYRMVVLGRNFEDKFTDQFIELVYVTLCAWNMNSRGAKLAAFDVFKDSLLANRDILTRLSNYRLDQLSNLELQQLLVRDARTLFLELTLVADSKPRLVTYSKTFHFFLPDLFVPIDRRYTLNYFFNNENIPTALERQFLRFSNIHEECRKLATSVQLDGLRDNTWNANIPKIIDNIIIGWQMLH